MLKTKIRFLNEVKIQLMSFLFKVAIKDLNFINCFSTCLSDDPSLCLSDDPFPCLRQNEGSGVGVIGGSVFGQRRT